VLSRLPFWQQSGVDPSREPDPDRETTRWVSQMGYWVGCLVYWRPAGVVHWTVPKRTTYCPVVQGG